MRKTKYTLKELRAREDWTQEEVANKLNVSTQTYNSWERNFGMIKISNGLKIAKLYGLTLDDIFFTNIHE